MRGSRTREVEIERIDGRIDALFRDRARKGRRRVKVGEGGRRRRVGQIVGRHVDRLDRSDRSLGRGRDALLQGAHIGGERRLIAHRRGNAAEKRRHLGTRLGKAENVIDEEQHILTLVAEILRHRQAGQRDTGTGARRLVHLAIDQRAFRAFAAALLVDAGFDELVIEVVALARALADAGEHRIAAMGLRDVVDQFLNDDGLADTGAAEQADLAAPGVRRQQVDDLDAGDQDIGLRSTARHRTGLAGECRASAGS